MTERYRADDPRGKHGRVRNDRNAGFGVDPDALRERFGLCFERFGLEAER